MQAWVLASPLEGQLGAVGRKPGAMSRVSNNSPSLHTTSEVAAFSQMGTRRLERANDLSPNTVAAKPESRISYLPEGPRTNTPDPRQRETPCPERTVTWTISPGSRARPWARSGAGGGRACPRTDLGLEQGAGSVFPAGLWRAGDCGARSGTWARELRSPGRTGAYLQPWGIPWALP